MANDESTGDVPDTVPQRDSARTRRALLAAARELFGARGYTATTLRQIAEQAGVDPALIVRYFGSKTALFIAALEADWVPRDQNANPPTLDEVIDRVVSHGATPLLLAAVVPTSDAEVRDAANRIVGERFIAPLLEEAEAAGLDRVQLRAEVTAAALAGIVLARAAGMFEALAGAGHDEVLALARHLTRCALDG